MRLIPYEKTNLNYASRKGDNRKLIEEFVDSGLECVKVEGWTHKHAKSAQWALQTSAIRYHYDHVKVATRDGEIFLINTLINT